MLLTFQGYFEAGQFIADTPVHIPERHKTIVTVLDETVDPEAEQEAHKKLWEKIVEDIQNSDEVLEGEPERLHFRTPEETEAL
jgi:RAB protein geranylgeranyltransferase component A